MATNKTVTTAAFREAAASSAVLRGASRARSLLGVWVVAARNQDPVTVDTVATLFTSINEVRGHLDGALNELWGSADLSSLDGDLLIARELVATIERALWGANSAGPEEAPKPVDLAMSGELAAEALDNFIAVQSPAKRMPAIALAR